MDAVAPIDGQVLTTVARGTTADMEAAIASARAAFDDGRWAGQPPASGEAITSCATAMILSRASCGTSLWTNRPFHSASARSGCSSLTVGTSGRMPIRSLPIEARIFTPSMQGRINCNVVLITSTSPKCPKETSWPDA